jgi:hypothetical protein
MALLPGQAVEVQWKKTANRLRFSHWWARVAAVRGPDRLVLEFPQYGTSGAPQATLCARAEVARREETHGLHGGVAGGVRVPTAAERLQWAEVRVHPRTCVPHKHPRTHTRGRERMHARAHQVLCGGAFDDDESGLGRIRAVFLETLGPHARAAVADGTERSPHHTTPAVP